MKLSDIRISGKLYGVILIAVFGMFGLASLSQFQMGRVYDATSYATINSVPSLLTISDAMNSFQNMRIAGALHVLNTENVKMVELERAIQDRRDAVEATLTKYEELVSNDEDKRLLYMDRALFEEYLVGFNQALVLSRKNQNVEARDLFAEYAPIGDKLERVMASHLAFNKKLAEEMQATALGEKQAAMTMSAGITILVLGLVIVIGWLIANRGVARPIAEIVNDLIQLASGKLDVEVSGQDRRDEVGEIARAAQVFKEFAQRIDMQGWVKTQVAALSGAMQTAESPEEFAQSVIGKIAPLLESGAAVFYIHHPESRSYRMMGSWGYREREHLPTSYRIGEGLVGQCARDGKAILLDDVPDDYFRISSGLGEAAPRVLLVTPVISKNRVVGMIEIASFSRFTEAQQALVEELMPVVALNLEIIERNMKTLDLLRETQEQAQKLQASEEEMRMQSEELTATNEELRASEEELRSQSDMQKAINEELIVKGVALQDAQELAERKATELETASRYKSDFLANMSHELRTPLNSLLILAKNLTENEDKNLTADQLESVTIIHDGGQHLLRLINDILDLSKVEAGKMTLVEDDVNLHAFATAIRRNFAALAKSQSLALSVDVAPDMPSVMRGDAGKMEQIVTNLIGNAFKFTKQGGVKVRLSRFAASADADERLVIAVEDSGIGIPAEKLELIFSAFEQVDGSSSREFGGTGLGLTISRRMANLLGGDIEVHSVEGEGSTFTLTLPLKFSNLLATDSLLQAGVPHPAAAFFDDRATLTRSDKTILIVEDDDVFARIECDLARKRGFKCLRAADGKSALQLAERYRPTGILLDIGLPDLDGWAVMSVLKQNPVTRDIPVRIISAKEDGERSLTMGAVGHLKKPVDKDELNEVFDRLSQVTGNSVRRVLIVDGDEVSLKAITAAVQTERAELFEARNGNTALEMLQSDQFDCLILDLELPDFSGFELLERATKQGIALPPVVVYTNKSLSYEENLALREYTDSIVVKGARSPERLADEVSLFLHSVQSSLPSLHRPAPSSGHVKELAGKTVLVVDDDMRNAFALSKVLRGKGLSVLLAQDGHKALAQLDENDEIHVVLMDIMMPGIDGYDTIREIRKQPRFGALPIVALTAKAMPGDREKCIRVGANDYFSKPVDVEQLVSVMSSLVK